jgi:hypothetical protein
LDAGGLVKSRKETKWIDRALVENPYCVGLCTNEIQFKRELKRLNIPIKNWPDWISNDKDATVHYFEHSEAHACCCLVCIDKKSQRSPSEVVGLLIHESVHIWQGACEKINANPPCDELEAYSIQTIAQRLIEAYGEYK